MPASDDGGRLRALGRRLGDESLVIMIAGLFFVTLASVAPYTILADSWLTLVGGREIAARGLPSTDQLAVISHGRDWIDQQWLSQLAFYRLERAYGFPTMLVVFVLLLLAPLVFVLVLARRRAPARSVAPIALLCVPALFSQLRAQVFSQVLFVLLLALLAAESRVPTRRVLFAFPLLALWANVHGAALVGAALCCALGASEFVGLVRTRARRPSRWLRSLVLVAAPWPCLLLSPYGLRLIPYYRSTIGNPSFRKYLSEWAPPTLSTWAGGLFYLTLAVAIVLVVRRRHELTLFELAALALTAGAAVLAMRSIVWFSFAALLLLPQLLERWWRSLPARLPLGGALAAVAITLCLAGGVKLVALDRHGMAPAAAHWPAPAVDAVRDAIHAHPDARVLANEEYADWLLWNLPELRGRLAFDGRWEVLSPAQMATVRNYLFASGAGWERPSRGYRVLVLDPTRNRRLVAAYDRRRGLRELYRSGRVVVYEKA